MGPFWVSNTSFPVGTGQLLLVSVCDAAAWPRVCPGSSCMNWGKLFFRHVFGSGLCFSVALQCRRPRKPDVGSGCLTYL